MNRLQIIGNLGRDPEVRIFQGNSQKACTLTVATTERAFVTNSGQQVPERTTWHTVSCWGALADACERMLQKGSRIYAEGTLHSNVVERDGTKIAYWQLDATSIEFLANLRPKMPETPPAPTNQAV